MALRSGEARWRRTHHPTRIHANAAGRKPAALGRTGLRLPLRRGPRRVRPQGGRGPGRPGAPQPPAGRSAAAQIEWSESMDELAERAADAAFSAPRTGADTPRRGACAARSEPWPPAPSWPGLAAAAPAPPEAAAPGRERARLAGAARAHGRAAAHAPARRRGLRGFRCSRTWRTTRCRTTTRKRCCAGSGRPTRSRSIARWGGACPDRLQRSLGGGEGWSRRDDLWLRGCTGAGSSSRTRPPRTCSAPRRFSLPPATFVTSARVLSVYWAVPTAPPWWREHGDLEPVRRIMVDAGEHYVNGSGRGLCRWPGTP